MPPAAPEARGRLAASAARLLHAARATLTRQRPSPQHNVIPAKAGTQATTRAFHVAEGAPNHGAHAQWASEALNKKASATGPLIAFQSLRQPVWTPRDYQAFAREGFMQNAIVYRCVRMIAEAAASVPLLLYAGDDEIAEHPLLRLVSRPNPLQAGPDLFESFYGHLLVSGNAYLEAVAIDGGAPDARPDAQWASGGRTNNWASEGASIRELHALRPDRMKVIPGPDGWPQAYDYTVGGRTIRIATEPVSGVRPILHMRLFHPDNDHYGLSPLEAAATAIDLHNTAAQWNKALLDNSARPSGALVYTARDGNLSAEQYERLKSELEAGFQGSANAGRPLLLEGGLDWKSMSLSPKDMDFIEARHVAAREIALALGVPPMLLGIPGDNTYSNLAEAQRIFWRQTVLPLVTRTATALTNWLAATYEPDARGARKDAPDLRLVPDLDAIEALSAERETLWARLEKTSFLTPDEKRAAIGYGPRPPADGNKFRSPTLTDKFSPTQPRIPAGRPGGGQWTDGDDGGGGVINDVTDVIATVLDQIDIEDIDLGPIDGDIGDEPDNLLHLIADRGSLLSPSAIRSLYRDYTGHHVVPLAETILRGNVLTPDAIDELSRRTVGGDGLKDQRDPDNPHRGRTTEHRDYSQAVRETTDRFTKDNGITKDNPMTREQAGRLADEVANSKDARIKRFLRSIEDYVGRSNTGNARIRVPRGGGRGQD